MLHHSFFLLFLADFDGFSLNKRHYVDSKKKKKGTYLFIKQININENLKFYWTGKQGNLLVAHITITLLLYLCNIPTHEKKLEEEEEEECNILLFSREHLISESWCLPKFDIYLNYIF